MNAQEALAALAEAERVSKVELTEVPYNVRQGWELKIAGAKQDLVTLKRSYGEALGSLITDKVLLQSSPEEAELLKGAVETLDGVRVYGQDASSLYRTILDSFWDNMGNRREFLSGCWSAANNVILDVTRQLGLRFVELELPPEQHLATKEDGVAMVRTLVKRTYGEHLNRHYLQNRLVQDCFDNQETNNFVWLLVNATPEEVVSLGQTLIGGPVVQLPAKKLFSKGVVQSEALQKFFSRLSKLGSDIEQSEGNAVNAVIKETT